MTRLTDEQNVELKYKQRARAKALHKLLNEALESLISTGKYIIRADGTPRWIDSDKWYKTSYYLCDESGSEEILYITTHVSYEKEFEDERPASEFHYGLRPNDIHWSDTGDPDGFRWCLKDMLHIYKLKDCLSEDLAGQIVAALTKDKLLEEEEDKWVKSLQG